MTKHDALTELRALMKDDVEYIKEFSNTTEHSDCEWMGLNFALDHIRFAAALVEELAKPDILGGLE